MPSTRALDTHHPPPWFLGSLPLKLPRASHEPAILTIPQDFFIWCLLTVGPTSRPKEYNKEEMYEDSQAAHA